MDMNGIPGWLAPLTLRWDRVLLGTLSVRCDVSLERDPDAPHDLRLRCDLKLRPVIPGMARTPSGSRRAPRKLGGPRRR